MSFLIDPPLLVASGAVIEKAAGDDPRAERAAAVTVATFVGVSLLLYANAPGLSRMWRPFGARSGREFMLTSGLAQVDERAMTPARHLAALSLFGLYPLWLRLGRALAKG